MQGTIHRLIRGKGFGFIHADGRQFFFHHSEVRDIAFKQLDPGDVVEFQPREEEEEGRNPRAVEIVVVEKKEISPRRSPSEGEEGREAERRRVQGRGRKPQARGGRGRRAQRGARGSAGSAQPRGDVRSDGLSRSDRSDFDGFAGRSLPSSPSDEWEEVGERQEDDWQIAPSMDGVEDDAFFTRPARGGPLRRESTSEFEEDSEFIQELPGSAGLASARHHESHRESHREGHHESHREGHQESSRSRGGSRGRRQGSRGRQKARRPKASGLPGEKGEGIIRAINAERGFGFIETPSGDIFFHKSGVREDFMTLTVGARVAFVFGQGDNGIKAEDVAVV